ncbi:MAG: hypothetical protein HFI43_05770 [Lachnospiraceae bacterium]|jgi:uncharacterized membrane protein|nr:hypothetical protein [Lachnospiraceae bacterium]
MYFLFAIFTIIAGICLFVFANRITKNRPAVTGVKIVGIALIVIGISISYLLFSGKVVLPLSKG